MEVSLAIASVRPRSESVNRAAVGSCALWAILNAS